MIEHHSFASFNIFEITLDLTGLNARDLGFKFGAIDLSNSIHVQQDPPSAGAVGSFGDFIHTGGSCGNPGGCDNISPHQGFMSGIHLNQLPARIRVKLWLNTPSANQNPDFTFDLNFD